MTVIAVTSASAGTKLATASDVKITGLTIAAPTSLADDATQLCLVDAATAADLANPVRTLYAADFDSLVPSIYAVKPNGPSMAPGLTAPTFPMNLVSNAAIAFSKGIYVKSCPTGVSFSLTTGP